MWPQVGKIEILGKQLSPTAQNHYADVEDTCLDNVMKFCVIVRYTKICRKKKESWGQIWPRVAVWGLRIRNCIKLAQNPADFYWNQWNLLPDFVIDPDFVYQPIVGNFKISIIYINLFNTHVRFQVHTVESVTFAMFCNWHSVFW